MARLGAMVARGSALTTTVTLISLASLVGAQPQQMKPRNPPPVPPAQAYPPVVGATETMKLVPPFGYFDEPVAVDDGRLAYIVSDSSTKSELHVVSIACGMACVEQHAEIVADLSPVTLKPVGLKLVGKRAFVIGATDDGNQIAALVELGANPPAVPPPIAPPAPAPTAAAPAASPTKATTAAAPAASPTKAPTTAAAAGAPAPTAPAAGAPAPTTTAPAAAPTTTAPAAAPTTTAPAAAPTTPAATPAASKPAPPAPKARAAKALPKGKTPGTVVYKLGPATHITVITRDKQTRVAVHKATPTTTGGTKHVVDLVAIETGRKIGGGKAFELDGNQSKKLELKVNHWMDGFTRVGGIKGGEWSKKENQRSPDVEAVYDLVAGKFVETKPITDLFEQRKRFQTLADVGGSSEFLKLAWDNQSIQLWRSGVARTLELDQPINNYDVKSLQGVLTTDGGAWFAMKIDPVNADAVARKKADPEYLDVFRAGTDGKAVRKARVLAKGVTHRFGPIADNGFWLVERSPGFDRGGTKLATYSVQ